MCGYLTITSQQAVNVIILKFPSNIHLNPYQYVLAYDANTANAYGIFVNNENVAKNDTKIIPVMNYLVIPNVEMNYS